MIRRNYLERRLFEADDSFIDRSVSRFRPRRSNSKFDMLLLELPQQLELLAAILVNGENIFFALKWLVQRTEGQFANGLRRLVQRVELGMNLEQALASFATETNSPMVAEFCGKLILSLERGTPLAGQLRNLAESASAQLQVQMLRRAGQNEVKMLIPLVFVILPVTVMVAVFPSFQLFQATI